MNSRRTGCSLLLLLVFFHGHIFTEEAEARAVPVPSARNKGHGSELQLLGLICRCCDGAGGTAGGECRSSWGSTCANLDCKPWKFF